MSEQNYITDHHTLTEDHGLPTAYPVHAVSRGDTLRAYDVTPSDDNDQYEEDMIGALELQRDRMEALQDRRLAKLSWAMDGSTKLTLGLGALVTSSGVSSGDAVVTGLGLSSLGLLYTNARKGDEDIERLLDGYDDGIEEFEDQLDETDRPTAGTDPEADLVDRHEALETIMQYSDVPVDRMEPVYGPDPDAVIDRDTVWPVEAFVEQDETEGYDDILAAAYQNLEAAIGTRAAHEQALQEATDGEYGGDESVRPYAEALDQRL